MANQHEYVFAEGADSRYSAIVMSPLDKAIRQLKEQGRRIIGFERDPSGVAWVIKVMVCVCCAFACGLS